MKEVGCSMPTKRDVVSSFLYGLCEDKYSELKNQLANARHFGMGQPMDLSEAYALASNYQVTSARVAYNRVRTVFSIQQERHSRKAHNRHNSNKPQPPPPHNTLPSAPPGHRPDEKKVNVGPAVKCTYCGRSNNSTSQCY
jgi:hypothetical protein